MKNRAASRTFSLLGERTETPSEYEVATSRLHYYVGRGFEVNVPLRQWYERYQQGSPLQCADWEVFSDPRETTYPRYTHSRKQSELELDRLCGLIEAQDAVMGGIELLSPLRFAFHGFHMIASYVGQMAPSGRITLAALFQAADEQRRIERIAWRVQSVQPTQAELDRDGRAQWQTAPAWQPLREAVERLLVAYDWGEAFVGLNLCLKPVLDELSMRLYADACEARRNAADAAILRCLYEDCVYQREWSAALVRTALAQGEGNREAIERWVARWAPRAHRAAGALAGVLASSPAAAPRMHSFHREFLDSLGIDGACAERAS